MNDAAQTIEALRAQRDQNRALGEMAFEMLAACVAVNRCGNAGAKLSRDASDRVRAVLAKANEILSG